jgi:hypothetical protein
MSSDEDSNSDIMATFLLPGHCANPQSFVTNYYQAAKNSTNPEHSLLDRHLVTDYGVNKNPGGPYHESFYANVFDKDTLDKQILIIDHTASNHSISYEDTFKSLSQIPEYKTVLATIERAVKDLPTNILASASESTDESKTPLLNDTSESSKSSTSTFSRAFSQALAAARSTSQSSSVGIEADDLITVVKKQELGQSMRQYAPSGLPLFALFERQCYWYANVIFDVLSLVFPSVTLVTPSSAHRILLPVNYFHQGAGRWKGILINDPRVVAAVVSIVKSEFEKKYGKYVRKVKKVNFLKLILVTGY